jgi:hypothetical protein
VTFQGTPQAKDSLANLSGFGAKSCDSAGRLQKVRANAGSRE